MNKKLLTKEECRKIQLNLLQIIDKICKDNNLKYYLSSGTLIGAVRHQGFIPWDDDIDIELMRKDYNKLITILKNQNEYKWVDVLDLDCNDYYYTFAKVVDNRTVAKMEDNLTSHGIWVDIFPNDNIPNGKLKRKMFIIKNYINRSIVMSMTTDFSSKRKIKYLYIKKILSLYSKFLNKKKFARKYNNYCQKYNNVDTKFVGCMFSPYRSHACLEKKWFRDQILLNFEGKKFYGPIDYDKYLSSVYGDYMKLPPKSKQKDHKIIAWKK